MCVKNADFWPPTHHEIDAGALIRDLESWCSLSLEQTLPLWRTLQDEDERDWLSVVMTRFVFVMCWDGVGDYVKEEKKEKANQNLFLPDS